MNSEETTELDQPLVIKKMSGQMYSCPDIRTLKRWIAEGRLVRDDLISNKGDRWFRLGDSAELSPSFDGSDAARVLDKPRARRNSSYPLVPQSKSREHSMARQRRLGDNTLDGMVSSFLVKRRARTAVLTIAGASLVVLAAGASFAMLGPKDNVLRTVLEERGILPGRILAEKAFAHHTGIAYTAWARGDITDHSRAEEMLKKAAELRPDDADVAANLALVYASHADALKRIAADEERDAVPLDEGDQKERLEKTAAARRARADELIVLAKTAVSRAEQLSPDGTPTLRALAEVGRVSDDATREKAAVLALEKKLTVPGNEDAWSYAVLARSAAPDPEHAGETANAIAEQRLQRAIELDPGMDRARVHLARIHAARGSLADAEKELTAVLGVMPSYEEAQRLMGHVRAEIAQGEEAEAAEKGA